MSKGFWVDELPSGYWKIFLDILTGARYYRMYEFSKYTGAPMFASGYYRCPAWMTPWLDKLCSERRIYKKEAFNPRKYLWMYHE